MKIQGRPKPINKQMRVLATLRTKFTDIGPASTVVRHAALLGTGAVFAQAIQALATPILGRLYEPKVYGLWALLLSVAAIPSALGGFRYELALLLSKTDSERARVLLLQTICNVLTTGLTVGIILLVGRWVATIVGSGALLPYMYAVPLLVFFTGASAAAMNWLTSAKQFGRLAKFRAAQSISTAGIQLGAAVLCGGRVVALVAGGVCGLLLPLLLLVKPVVALSRSVRPGALSIARVWSCAAAHRRFPLFVVPYGYIGVLRERGLIMLLGIYATTRDIGLYSLALRLAYVPVTLISAAVSPIVYQRAAQDYGRDDLAFFIHKVLRTLVIAATPIFVIVAWYARDVFAMFLGKRWIDAGVYATILAGPASTQLCAGVLDRMMDIIGKQHAALILESVYTAVALAAFVLGLTFLKSVFLTIALFAVVTMAYHVAWILTVYLLFRFPCRDLLAVAATFLSLAAATVAVLWSVRTICSPLMGVALTSLLAGAYYLRFVSRFRSLTAGVSPAVVAGRAEC